MQLLLSFIFTAYFLVWTLLYAMFFVVACLVLPIRGRFALARVYAHAVLGGDRREAGRLVAIGRAVVDPGAARAHRLEQATGAGDDGAHRGRRRQAGEDDVGHGADPGCGVGPRGAGRLEARGAAAVEVGDGDVVSRSDEAGSEVHAEVAEADIADADGGAGG
jgi:hypothetical protein